MEPPSKEPIERRAHFTLWDTICIIVGIIIGTGIFETPPSIFSQTAGPYQAFAVWILGGLLCIVGGFCFAELATTYPRSGGEYVYLTRAFGPWAGFFFAWGQLLIVRTGASIVPFGFVFADYALKLLRSLHLNAMDAKTWGFNLFYALLALGPIVVLTAVNIVGLRSSKWTQNALTTIKVLGLGGVVAAGAMAAWTRDPATEPIAHRGTISAVGQDSLELRPLSGASPMLFHLAPGAKVTLDGNEIDDWPGGVWNDKEVKVLTNPGESFTAFRVIGIDSKPQWVSLCLALVAVFWTYSGWNEGAYVAAEVVRPRRNLPRSLLISGALVTALYLLVNWAFLAALGYEAAADSSAIAADVLSRALGPFGESAMCVLVLLSALGAINGMLVTNSRIFAEFGRDHSFFAPVGRWHPRLGTPVNGLAIQLAISAATIAAVAIFSRSGEGGQAFFDLIAGTAPAFWLFFLATGIALFVLRWKDPAIERPFPAPGYPLTPLIYCGICLMMILGSVYASLDKGAGVWLCVLVLGLPLYWLTRRSPSTIVEKQATEPVATAGEPGA